MSPTARARRKSAPRTASPKLACVLAVGGLDPGGGAGILCDARAIAHAGAFCCAAAAVLTVQSTSGLRSTSPVPARELIAECTEVVRHQRVRAIKVGALGSAENARAMGDFLAIHRDVPSVVDTVIVPTRGRTRLLEERAVAALRDRLVPKASLVTANAPEAEALLGSRVTRLDEAHDAALALLDLGPRAVLLKGGHLGGPHAVDLLALAGPNKQTPARVIELAAARLRLPPLHGGGCALASLVAGRIAVRAEDYDADPGRAIADAVRWAKKLHHEALVRASDVGGDMRVILA